MRMYDDIIWHGVKYKSQDLGAALNTFFIMNNQLHKKYPNGRIEEFWYTGLVTIQTGDWDEYGLRIQEYLLDLYDGEIHKIREEEAYYQVLRDPMIQQES